MKLKTLKLLGIIFTIFGFAAGIGSDIISEKQMEAEIEEQINEKLKTVQTNEEP